MPGFIVRHFIAYAAHDVLYFLVVKRRSGLGFRVWSLGCRQLRVVKLRCSVIERCSGYSERSLEHVLDSLCSGYRERMRERPGMHPGRQINRQIDQIKGR